MNTNCITSIGENYSRAELANFSTKKLSSFLGISFDFVQKMGLTKENLIELILSTNL